MNRLLIVVPLAATALAAGFFAGYLRFSQLAAHALRDELEVVVRPKFDNDRQPDWPTQPTGVSMQRSEGRPAEFVRKDAEFSPVTTGGMKSAVVRESDLPAPPQISEGEQDEPIPPQGRILRTNHSLEVISRIYTIDKLYRSMKGPWSENRISLLDQPEPELCWITGCHVEMVGEDGRTKMPEQFMCHANLDIGRNEHASALGLNKPIDERLFTLSQGHLHVQFPPGCGLPMMSSETISLITQVLNLNFPAERFKVRHKVRIDFIRDRDLTAPLRPLYEAGVSAMKTLEDKSLVYDYAPEGAETASGLLKSMCMPGLKANEFDEQADRGGHKFTGHWVVRPGREENRTRVTTLLNLPFDTTAHHIAVHLHPFAETLELRDVTTGQTVFKSRATQLAGQVGLARVEYLSSETGIPLFQNHEYELISRYNNTSKGDVDSMAVMYLYLLDKEFPRK